MIAAAALIFASAGTVAIGVITTIGVVAAPTWAFIRWSLSRGHDEEVEDTKVLSEAIGVVTAANISIAQVVHTLMEPLQNEVNRLAVVSKERGAEIDILRDEQELLQRRFTSIVRYVNILRHQVRAMGHDPAPIPPDLDLSDFNFD